MPARRNPKKTRTPRVTPLGVDPAAGPGPLSPTRPDLDLAVEPVLPAALVEPVLPAALVEPVLPAALAEPALPAALVEPVLPAAVLDEVAPPVVVPAAVDVPAVVEVPAVVDAPAMGDLPKTAGRPKAPTAGPPQGGVRSGGGRSQQTGQARRYAFRRS
ncbi:hypothetical protein ACLQ3B_00445 [Micromonospora sp. DT53]|uniref:hypothetical protein n=1 Tax=Micromonospora sp. DT53 TaxID=3393444 RepID=UPI003CF08386